MIYEGVEDSGIEHDQDWFDWMEWDKDEERGEHPPYKVGHVLRPSSLAHTGFITIIREKNACGFWIARTDFGNILKVSDEHLFAQYVVVGVVEDILKHIMYQVNKLAMLIEAIEETSYE